MSRQHGARRNADRLLRDLAHLTPLAPDPERAGRLRERCRGVLVRTHQRSCRAQRVAGFLQGTVTAALLGLLCVLYTIVLFVLALR